MKLYYSPGACSLADHIAIHEAGLDHALVKVDLKTKRTEDGRDFKEVNAKGYVPALELDDGAVLTENLAVLSYLADTSGKLLPADGLRRYRVLEGAAFVSTELHKNFKPFFVPDASDADKSKAREMLAQRFALAADAIGPGGFFAGEAMSIADCYLFVMLMWARKNEVPLPDALTVYYERLKARPAVQGALKMEGIEAP